MIAKNRAAPRSGAQRVLKRRIDHDLPT